MSRYDYKRIALKKKNSIRDPYVNGNILYLDYILVKILVVILCYSFVRCYHWGKQGNRWMESPCTVSHHFMWIHSDMRVKSLKYKWKHASRDTGFSFCLRLQCGSAHHCLHLTSIPPCLFSLIFPTQTWGARSDCRMDYLKTGLSWESWALNTSRLPTPLVTCHSTFQDLAPYKADIKAHGSPSRQCISKYSSRIPYVTIT